MADRTPSRSPSELELAWQTCQANKPPSALLLQPGLSPAAWGALLARRQVWGQLGIAQGAGWQIVLGATDETPGVGPLLPDLSPYQDTSNAPCFLGHRCGLHQATAQVYLPLTWRLDAPQSVLNQHLDALRQVEGCPLVLLPRGAGATTSRLLRLDKVLFLADIDVDAWAAKAAREAV